MINDLPAGPFGVIYADPPWDLKAGRNARHPATKYKVMGIKAIEAMPVREIRSPDCLLFMWTTSPFLELSFRVMKAWGFRYSAIGFTWVKLWPREADALMFDDKSFAMGTGFTTRKNTELCLIGKRGKPKRHDKGIRELIISPRREHSRKPEEARRRIERYAGADAAKIELFARTTRPGWTAWGNEREHFAD